MFSDSRCIIVGHRYRYRLCRPLHSRVINCISPRSHNFNVRRNTCDRLWLNNYLVLRSSPSMSRSSHGFVASHSLLRLRLVNWEFLGAERRVWITNLSLQVVLLVALVIGSPSIRVYWAFAWVTRGLPHLLLLLNVQAVLRVCLWHYAHHRTPILVIIAQKRSIISHFDLLLRWVSRYLVALIVWCQGRLLLLLKTLC